MGTQQDDKTILAQLEQAIGQELGARAEYNQDGQLIALDLSKLSLTLVPVELCQLTNLQHLYLYENQLSEVPVELGQLSNLQRLYLDNNQLSEVPVELGQLSIKWTPLSRQREGQF
jgi:Leucine-rich repeat (LRR) protein